MTASPRQTVLIVDDEQINLEYLGALLKKEYDVITARDGEQALARVADLRPDLVILDIMMPGMDGYEVCRRLKTADATNPIPIIFVTALDAPENEERGLTLGALDYIVKPFHPAIVRARVGNILTMARQRELLEELANVDGLTEISNRRHYEATLQKEWFRCMRDKKPLSVAMLDIDFFKQFNDQHGHAEGDRVLRNVANVLRHFVRRPGDMAARYGGEEFVLLFPGTPASGGREIAHAILAAIKRLGIRHDHSPYDQTLTASIGGGTQIPKEGDSIAVLSQTADMQLYEAKSKGRNRIAWLDIFS